MKRLSENNRKERQVRKKSLVLLMILFFVCAFSTSFAEPTRAQMQRHADKNKDGVVDKKEMHMEKKWERGQWMKNRSKVNTPVEAKYDKNGDGFLDPGETRQMLRDRYEVIKTDGKARVNTPLEAEYDANHDGILDLTEAYRMHEDIK